ncbi:hypothetical protein HK101_007416 [Irineochytrium annulatum]|nr:hypothetical protein HK101_007416 [Irineochytrium annulatum]
MILEIDYVCASHAVWLSGRTCVYLNTKWSPAVINSILHRTGVTHILHGTVVPPPAALEPVIPEVVVATLARNNNSRSQAAGVGGVGGNFTASPSAMNLPTPTGTPMGTISRAPNATTLTRTLRRQRSNGSLEPTDAVSLISTLTDVEYPSGPVNVRDIMRDEITTRPAEIACVTPTSGSTGVPKSIVYPTSRSLEPLAIESSSMLRNKDGQWLRGGTTFLRPLFEIRRFMFNQTTLYLDASTGVVDQCQSVINHLNHPVHGKQPLRVHFTPSIFRAFTDFAAAQGAGKGVFPSVYWMVVGGENVDLEIISLAKKVFPNATVAVNYACSEVGFAGVCQHFIKPTDPVPSEITFSATQGCKALVLLDLDTNEVLPSDCPAGTTGIVGIVSAHTATSYVANPTATAHMFRPYGRKADNEILLYTDDVGRMTSSGRIAIVGRRSRSVKVNGVFVDLDQVEGVLKKCLLPGKANTNPPMAQSIKVVTGSNRTVICYAVPNMAELQGLSAPDIEVKMLEIGKEALRAALEKEDVPLHVVRLLDDMPYNASFKIDMNLLQQWADSGTAPQFSLRTSSADQPAAAGPVAPPRTGASSPLPPAGASDAPGAGGDLFSEYSAEEMEAALKISDKIADLISFPKGKPPPVTTPLRSSGLNSITMVQLYFWLQSKHKYVGTMADLFDDEVTPMALSVMMVNEVDVNGHWGDSTVAGTIRGDDDSDSDESVFRADEFEPVPHMPEVVLKDGGKAEVVPLSPGQLEAGTPHASVAGTPAVPVPTSVSSPASTRQIRFNPLNFMTVSWMNPIMAVGAKRALTPDDLPRLPTSDEAEVAQSWVSRWFDDFASWRRLVGEGKVKPTNPPRILTGVYKASRFLWFFSAFLWLVSILAQICVPLLLQQIIVIVNAPPLPDNATQAFIDAYNDQIMTFTGGFPLLFKTVYPVAGILLAARILASLTGRASDLIVRRQGFRYRSVLVGAIYGKALRTDLNGEFSKGHVLNLVNVDCESISKSLEVVHLIWSIPLQIVINMILLSRLLGPAVWAGVGALAASLVLLILIVPIFMGRSSPRFAAVNDVRIKFIRELLDGIKLVKMRGWSALFADKVQGIRAVQVGWLTTFNTGVVCFVIIGQLSNTIMPVAAFTRYGLTNATLKASIIFPAISFFAMLVDPLIQLPQVLSAYILSLTSRGRIQKFLCSKERVRTVGYGPDGTNMIDPIVITNATFAWPPPHKEEPKGRGRGGRGGRGGAKGSPKKGRKGVKSEDLEKEPHAPTTAVTTTSMLTTPSEDTFKNNPSVTVRFVDNANTIDEYDDDSDGASTINGVSMPRADKGKGKEVAGSASLPMSARGRAASAESQFQLHDINITIRKGSLTAIVGSVGCGKTTLLAGILGEVNKIQGQVHVTGNVAYCTQQPWIRTGTVEDNILFGQPLDVQKLRKVVMRTQMQDDIDSFSHGFQTEIGEKGVNLSGGQKARIAVARAAYSNAEIVILDDPLAALDQTVSRAVFEDCIQHELHNRTRIITTHKRDVLAECDHIIYMQNGRILHQGTFPALMATDEFAEYMMAAVDLEDDVPQGPKQGASGEKKKMTRADTLRRLRNNQPGRSREMQKKKEEEDSAFALEDRETGSVKWSTYKSYILGAGGWPIVVALVTLLLVYQGATIIMNQWLTWWTDVYFENQPTSFYVQYYNIIAYSSVLILCLLNVVILRIIIRNARTLHNAALAGLMNAPAWWFDTQPIGRIMNRFTKDVESIDQRMMPQIFQFVSGVGALISILVILIYSAPFMIAVLVPLFVLYLFVLRFYRATVRELKRLESTERSPFYAHISETFDGIPTITAYGVEGQFIEKANRLLDKSNKPAFLRFNADVWITLRMEILSAFVVFTLACISSTNIAPSPSQLGLALIYASSMSYIMNLLLKSAANAESEMNSVERLVEYAVDLPEEDPPVLQSDPPEGTWPKRGMIEFRNVTAYYHAKPDKAVLRGVSLKIHPGESVCIVGRTGSGKSTLLSCLMRLVDVKGYIAIDNRDINAMGIETVRKGIEIIPQDPFLFSGTIRDSLDLLRKFTDDEIWVALELVGMHEYVAAMPNGLETVMDNGGQNLSVGQRQLFCLARSLLIKPKILLMDEATSSIDQESDNKLKTAIREHCHNATLISVVHRIRSNLVRDCDTVVVMNNGVVAEQGPPLQLLRDPNSLFSRLYLANAGDIIAAACVACWICYITVNVLNTWSPRTIAGTVPNLYWATATATLCYSFVLCGILHMSFVRFNALLNVKSAKRMVEITGYTLCAVVFAVRFARTVLIFVVSSQTGAVANAGLSQNATNLQIATLLPVLFIRLGMDVYSIYKLQAARAKYMESCGMEAFRTIVGSLVVECLFSVLAILVGFQEQLNYTGSKLSFCDWWLMSWCLSSWIEQKPLYQLIFRGQHTSMGSSNDQSMSRRTTISKMSTNNNTAGANTAIKHSEMGKDEV